MKIGIRREDKNIWERRVPLTPEHVKKIIGAGVEVVVQPSGIRALKEAAYRDAGAQIDEDLSSCRVVFAVKEIPVELFRKNGAYVYFAHVIKGQPHNMPMLKKLLELECTLIDYEKVTNDSGRRLVFFGRHAGLAGMMDSLWALGRRLESEGFQTPFSLLKATHEYADLDEVKLAVRDVGQKIRLEDLPDLYNPMVFGFAGYGNVSQGAQEIFDLLPHKEISPEQLAKRSYEPDARHLYKVVFKEEHMAKPKDAAKQFELQEYYDQPELYQANFAQYVPHLTALINCIYWSPKYPRLVTKELLRAIWSGATPPRLKILGDISCDVEGALECTLKSTEPDDPVFVYKVQDDSILSGVEGDGPVVLAVDNLPCELPVESSWDFGNALIGFVPEIARANYFAKFEDLALPAPIKRAVIAHRGKLAPNYEYLYAKLDG